MIFLSARRKTVQEIVGFFDVCQAAVRFWIQRFNAEGLSGLYDRKRSGRPCKVTHQAVDSMLHMLHGDPWLQLKNKIAANRLYGSMKVLIETVEMFFDEMTPAKALVWAAA
jgi:transposase